MPCSWCALLLAFVAACSVDPSALLPTDAGGAADSATDGGVGDACRPRPETCNDIDDDCDGTVDEGFDTLTDPENCGACGATCTPNPSNAAPGCVEGVCRPLCDLGFADCNGVEADGCETNFARSETCGACDVSCGAPTPLCQASAVMSYCVSGCIMGTTLCGTSCIDTESDVLNCSDCGVACAERANATRECVAGRCGFRCDEGWDDCDDDPLNGCEASLDDVATCGRCSRSCSRPNTISGCLDRNCDYECAAGFLSCDGRPDTGCEVASTTSMNCGSCGVACDTTHASGGCSTGACMLSCDPGFEDCNGDGSDGCEAGLDDDPTNCGRCGTACSGGDVCIGGTCLRTCPGTCAESCDRDDPCGCVGDDCDFTCGTSNCQVDCIGDSTNCTVDGDGVPSNFVGTCADGADCTYTFRGTSNVSVDCSGPGTTCDVGCRDASNCFVACDGGAECLVDCQAASNCMITSCSGTVYRCGNDLICNRGCP